MSSPGFEKAAALVDLVPRIDPDGYRLAVELYRQLARGEPVPRERLAEALGTSTKDVEAHLEDEQLKGWTYYDDARRVRGFRGLAVASMPHRFTVEGQTLYTWCALDSLFIPEILGKPAEVESRCPQTDTAVKLIVNPDGVGSVEPADVRMSFILGDPEVVKTNPAKIMSSFCHHIFFFASAEAGSAWAAKHEGDTLLLTLEEAFALGKRFNAVQFGDELARRVNGTPAL